MKLGSAAEMFKEIKPWTRSGVAAFLEMCQVEDTADLAPADLAGYLPHLATKGYAAGTIKAYRTQTNAFFWWLVDGGLVQFGPEALAEVVAEQYRDVPVRTRERPVVPEEKEVRELVEAAHRARPSIGPDTARGRRQRLTYLRNIAIVEMLRATGIRPGELVSLRRCDLDEGCQCATAPDGRRLHFDLESWGALARYLAARGDAAGQPLLVWQAPVFARHDAQSAGQGLAPLSPARVGRILAGLKRGCGLKPRDLRARFGQRLLEATKDERGTGRLLGLKNKVAVRRYRPEE